MEWWGGLSSATGETFGSCTSLVAPYRMTMINCYFPLFGYVLLLLHVHDHMYHVRVSIAHEGEA